MYGIFEMKCTKEEVQYEEEERKKGKCKKETVGKKKTDKKEDGW